MKRKVEFIESYIKVGNDYQWNDNHGELIRCKDCKYNSNTEGNYVLCDIIPQMFGKTPDDNYCSWAERKQE